MKTEHRFHNGSREVVLFVCVSVVGFVAPLVFQPQTPEPAPDMTKTLQILDKMMDMFDLALWRTRP